MKEGPILFSAPMVRALLDDSKTQTRRVLKQAIGPSLSVGIEDEPGVAELSWLWGDGPGHDVHETIKKVRCPYGVPGDRLWVRENGWERPERTPKMMREGADTWAPYYFDADGLSAADSADFKEWGFKRRPSIHMPRAFSRIDLEVTGVRVERLQDISRDDAQAEGCDHDDACDHVRLSCAEIGCLGPDYRVGYRNLWEQINGAGSWAANPYVWVVEFRRVRP
jgi:hypothetical protein